MSDKFRIEDSASKRKVKALVHQMSGIAVEASRSVRKQGQRAEWVISGKTELR